MKIKNIEIKNNLILAPMAGVSDVAFRELAVLFGADYAVGEMVSAKALIYESKKTEELLITSENEKILVAQIFGSNPSEMALICKSKHMHKFDIIDINMGCPAPKIVKNGEGSALMKDIQLAEKIIRACVEATKKPITVKFRSGWDENSINAVEFAKMCENAGASAITIHGRTQSQGYSGFADLEVIKNVKNAVSIPVIASGDVVDKNSYENMINVTKVDAVMIGRGSFGKPEIFAEILEKNIEFSKIEIVKKHVEILRKFYCDSFISAHMKKHFLWYLKGVKNTVEIKQNIMKTNDIDVIILMLEKVL